MDCEKSFLDYTADYDHRDEKVAMKIKHTLAVAKNMDLLTAKLGLDDRTKELSHIVAIFHDLGRFEQIKRYHTFLDLKSVDHAELSAELLADSGLLSELSDGEKTMVDLAIRNHNKLTIQPGLDARTELLCKLVRDADKVDIFRVLHEENLLAVTGKEPKELAKDRISPEVYRYIMEEKCCPVGVWNTPLDRIVSMLGFCFDINFKESFLLLRENKDYRSWFDRTVFENEQTEKEIRELLNTVEKFMDKRLAE